jgi:hypothetical protein
VQLLDLLNILDSPESLFQFLQCHPKPPFSFINPTLISARAAYFSEKTLSALR